MTSVYRFNWSKHGEDNVQEKLLSPFPEEFKTDLKKAKNKNEAEKVIKDYLSQNLKNRKVKYNALGKKLEAIWLKQGPDIENKLQRLY